MLEVPSPRTLGRWFSVGSDPLRVVTQADLLTCVFQPVVDLRPKGRLLHSVECLTRGPLGTELEDADALFEMVRRRGAEVEMDRRCVANALRCAAELADVPRLSINVHAVTLAEDDAFVGFLLDQVRKARLSPSQLIVDVVATREIEPALVGALDVLRSVGVGIAVDDVGARRTDYEGLAACRPDYLKLDRSLIGRNSAADDLRDLMVESLARFARGIGAQVVAEGVQTLDELDAAMSHGVTLVQGYFFGEPMTAQALAASGLLAGDDSVVRS